MDLNLLKNELDDHGELHVVVEEHEHVAGDDYIGLRKGNTDFNRKKDLIYVDDGQTQHVIDVDRVVYFHKPVEFPD